MIKRLVVLGFSLFLPMVPGASSSWIVDPQSVKVYIRKQPGHPAAGVSAATFPASLLSKWHAIVVDEQSAYLVVQLPAHQASAFAAEADHFAESVEIHEDFDQLAFRVLPRDVRSQATGIPPLWYRANSLAPPARDLFVLQFASIPTPSWYAALIAADATVVNYMPANAYIVLARLDRLKALAKQFPVQYLDVLQPIHKVDPDLLADTSPVVDCVVQVATVPEAADAFALIESETLRETSPPEETGDTTTLHATLSTASLPHIASLPAVVWLERSPERVLAGEREAHVIAGGALVTGASQVPGTVLKPVAGNYRQWLIDQGLNGSGTNYRNATKVAVLDTGFDKGSVTDVHPDFKRSDLNQSFVSITDYIGGNACTIPSCDNSDCIGHGTLVASTLAGNAGGPFSSATTDAGGDFAFYEGLGVAPAAQLVLGRIWNYVAANGGNAGPPSFTAVFPNLVSQGVGIANNSWSDVGSWQYNSDSQLFDKLVRSATVVNQGSPMSVVFAAGNYQDGGVPPNCSNSGSRYIEPPGNAKNVVAVGGSEGFNPSVYTDPNLCPAPDNHGQYSDNANDMWTLSAIGHVADTNYDGRVKPDVVAPASAIEGAHTRSASSCNPGSGSSDAVIDSTPASPHGWSRGTSFAAPAATGAADLLYAWFKLRTAGTTPKPSLLKAMLINFAYDMPGHQVDMTSYLGHPPDLQQGWGKVDLTRAFKTDGRYDYSNEQLTPFTNANQIAYFPAQGSSYTILDPSRPVRVTLVWTDAYGNLSANPALKNDLDLKVSFTNTSPSTYALGNAIDPSTGRSFIYSTGGSYDRRNNVEQVVFTYLDVGSIQFSVSVTAHAIVADAINVWGGPQTPQQDFSIFIDNVANAGGANGGLGTSAPSGLIATATSGTSVSLQWTAAPGATSYTVYRRAHASDTFTAIASGVTATSYPDGSNLSPNNTYGYEVTAQVNGTTSPASNIDLATTVVFTDPQDPIGNVAIKADHINQLRTAVNAVRTYAGLSTFTNWTDKPTVTAGQTPVKGDHVTELRLHLDEALGPPATPYTDGSSAPGSLNGSTVRGTHIDELRRRVE